MNEISSVTINIHWLVLVLLALVSFAASYFYTRIVVPKISSRKKILLIISRSLSLFLILLLLFEPSLQIVKKIIKKPVTYFFIDNSSSIINKDSVRTKESVKNFLEDLKDLKSEVKFFSFGEYVNEIGLQNFNYKFNGKQTNFENISAQLSKSSDNIAAAVILSDGNINSGNTSLEPFSKLGFPIFTVGLTDTSESKDISIKNLRYNSNLYKGSEANISAAIYNSGFAGQSVKVKLFQKDLLIGEKIIELSSTNIDHVDFKYKPEKAGNIDLQIAVDVLKNESNIHNNHVFFRMNIFENKLRISILSSTPSKDLSILKESLASDTNRIISSFVNINNEASFNSNTSYILDSTDVFVIISFPSELTSSSQISKLAQIIRKEKKPTLFLVNDATEITRLKEFNFFLPIEIYSQSDNSISVQSEFSTTENFFVDMSSKDERLFWTNLPPIQYGNYKLSLKNKSQIVAYATSKSLNKKEPLIVYGNEDGIKCISLLGWNFWRWTLQNSEYSKQYFTSFIDNIIKWLSLNNSTNRFIVKPIKNNFYQNEEIIFNAELYDEKLQPLDNQGINLTLQDKNNILKTTFISLGNGIYEARIISSFEKEVSFEAFYGFNGDTLKHSGRIKISEQEIEKIANGRSKNYLANLANNTGGEYFDIENYSDLLNKLNVINKNQPKEFTVISNFNLYSNYWILVMIISLLSMEWLIRKLNYLK